MNKKTTGMNPKESIGNISQQAVGYYTFRFAGLFTASGRHNLTSKLQRTLFPKFGSHYNLPIPIRYAFGIGVSPIKIIMVAVILLICIPVTLSFGQYRPNAPFKPKTIMAPDFSLQDLQGKTFKLRSQLGKPVVIFFGTTWCPSCRAEIPAYTAIYEKYNDRGLEVIYIDINEPAEKVARFTKSYSLPYLVLLDRDGSVANDYNIVGVPTLVLIDKEGNIITISYRTSDLPLNKLFPASK